MRNFLASLDGSNLINGLHIWGESSMDTQDLSFDKSSDAQIIENLCAVLPRVGVTILSYDFVIKSINGCDLSTLVISSQKGNISGVSDFESHKQLERFDRIVPSVHKISHEDV